MFNTIILADEHPNKNWDEQSSKALLRINGKTMSEYVINAAKGARSVDKVIMIGDKRKLESALSDKPDAFIESKGSILEALNRGIDYLGREKPILVCTSDIPMITPAAINEFADKSLMLKADLCYPLIEKKLMNARFPEIELSFLKIKEGSFTGGNLIYVSPNVSSQGLAFVEKILEFKKNPVKMAGILGFSFMMEYSMGTITIEKIEKKFSGIANIKIKSVLSGYPEIAFDIKKAADVIVAAANLS
jgi:hypothetical protein